MSLGKATPGSPTALPRDDPWGGGHHSLQVVSPLHREQAPRVRSGALGALLAAPVGGLGTSQRRAAA